MAFYKLTLHRFQRNKRLDWEQQLIIESTKTPKVGEGKALTVDPPIYEQVVSVQRLCERRKF